MFSGAMRHTGLSARESTTILEHGERVLTENNANPTDATIAGLAALAGAARAGGDTHVTVIGAPAGLKVNESHDGNGGRRVDVVIDETVARSIGSDRGAFAMAGYGSRLQTVRR